MPKQLNMFKVLIIGAEETGDYEKFRSKTIYYLKNKKKSEIMIYSLGDEYIDIFAKSNDVDTKFFPTDWKRYGKDALKERAESVLSDCDAIIAFKTKKDTEKLIKMAEEKNIPIRRVT